MHWAVKHKNSNQTVLVSACSTGAYQVLARYDHRQPRARGVLPISQMYLKQILIFEIVRRQLLAKDTKLILETADQNASAARTLECAENAPYYRSQILHLLTTRSRTFRLSAPVEVISQGCIRLTQAFNRKTFSGTGLLIISEIRLNGC